jgi:hypothetical protein
MDDAEFQTLQIKASIAPSSEGWPSGELKPSIMGDKPTWGGDPTWHALHEAVNHARSHVANTFAKLSAVDSDKNLSTTGKAAAKQEIAKAALDGLKQSKKLAEAQERVAKAVAKWDEQSGLHPESPSPEEAAIQGEIRRHIASLKENKVAFITKHVGDPRVVAAVLHGPNFLSGLSSSDIEIIKSQIIQRNAPELAERREAATKALAETEAGWRNAATQISAKGGLKGKNDGGTIQ